MDQGTVFGPSLEGMKSVRSPQGQMITKPFLDVCKHILPVIEKFGAAMALVKSDVGGNITRLENKYLSNPAQFNHLYSLLQIEVDAKTAKESSSCTNGLLWLTRALDFLLELFRNLLEHRDWTMSQACSDSYAKTLKQWHGWLASSSFSVAMKLAPDRKKFMDVIGGGGDIMADIEKFCTNFPPLLQENHKFLLQEVSLHALNQELEPKMATKVKGIFKGLRYISHIFGEKEQEIQIGAPTDVKHVAHIGWDGPSANSTPSWMTEFKSAQETAGQVAVKELSSRDVNRGGMSLAAQELVQINDIPKSTSHQSKKDGKSKKSSRRRSKDVSGMESPAREGSSRHSRRSCASTASVGYESPSRDLPVIPKTRRKKGSTDSTDRVSKSSRMAKGQNSLPDMSIEGSDNSSPMHSGLIGEKSSEIIPAAIH